MELWLTNAAKEAVEMLRHGQPLSDKEYNSCLEVYEIVNRDYASAPDDIEAENYYYELDDLLFGGGV